MRLLSLLWMSAIFASCKQEMKKYYIITHRNEQSIITGEYNKRGHLDSVSVENDSVAFWRGVIQYTSNKMAENLLHENGVKNLPYTTFDFDVLDETGNSILKRISEPEKKKAHDFIEQHQNSK